MYTILHICLELAGGVFAEGDLGEGDRIVSYHPCLHVIFGKRFPDFRRGEKFFAPTMSHRLGVRSLFARLGVRSLFVTCGRVGVRFFSETFRREGTNLVSSPSQG